MTLLKTINAHIQQGEEMLESSELSGFFDENGLIVQESINGFVVGAKKLVDELHIDSETAVTQEPTPQEIAKLEKFAVILAGLEYFRIKNVGPDERKSLDTVLDDANITNYVKKMAVEKSPEMLDEIRTYFYKGKILRREGLDKMIEEIRKFYMSKKANVGPLLHVSHEKE